MFSNSPLVRPRLIALVAGAVSATAFAPLDWWVAGLVCLAILLRLTHEAPTLKQALLRGWLFGLGHFTVNNNWFNLSGAGDGTGVALRPLAPRLVA